MKTILHLLIVFGFLVCNSSHAETIRISFLNDSGVLKETTELLKKSGCRNDGVAAFRKAVERYYSIPFELDLSKFPQVQHGFYSFQSSTQILALLPHALRLTPHPWEFNCFDTVIVASAGQLQVSLSPNDISGVFLAPQMTTNFALLNLPVATARDAFDFSVPAWYREVSQGFIPKSMIDARINLIAALYGNYVLPASTTEDKLNDAVLSTLRVNWKRQAITFPAKFEVISCHAVHLPSHQFTTLHAGLLFTLSKGYSYLEKDSGNGPFVRLDFDNKSDLVAWLSSKFDRQENEGGRYRFATFNDTKIEALRLDH
ncbi:MAG: DUF4300 family protein [Verrucomicrobia bacterium]|nr:DUF4300 family protein [Verrucomicrobiota bacterium]